MFSTLAEARGKAEVARALLMEHASLELIEKVTGLSKDEILSLR
jgi:hypothetical protein